MPFLEAYIYFSFAFRAHSFVNRTFLSRAHPRNTNAQNLPVDLVARRCVQSRLHG